MYAQELTVFSRAIAAAVQKAWRIHTVVLADADVDVLESPLGRLGVDGISARA